MANGVIIAITGTSAFTPEMSKKLAEKFRGAISDMMKNQPLLKMAIHTVTVEEVIE